MTRPRFSALSIALLAASGLVGACRPAGPPPAGPPQPQVVLQPGMGAQPVDAAIPASVLGPRPHTQADVEFMQGMIPHHAQAVRMARWAEANGARSDVRILSERIIVSQRDEIRLMQNWLRERNEFVPDSNATHHRHTMGGTVHEMLMPGMLTDEELARLERARGSDFDRLFLNYMIRHHEGAIDMVRQLFNSPGAGQEDVVFRFASDVEADQSAEIHRMRVMLSTVPPV